MLREIKGSKSKRSEDPAIASAMLREIKGAKEQRHGAWGMEHGVVCRASPRHGIFKMDLWIKGKESNGSMDQAMDQAINDQAINDKAINDKEINDKEIKGYLIKTSIISNEDPEGICYVPEGN